MSAAPSTPWLPESARLLSGFEGLSDTSLSLFRSLATGASPSDADLRKLVTECPVKVRDAAVLEALCAACFDVVTTASVAADRVGFEPALWQLGRDLDPLWGQMVVALSSGDAGMVAYAVASVLSESRRCLAYLPVVLDGLCVDLVMRVDWLQCCLLLCAVVDVGGWDPPWRARALKEAGLRVPMRRGLEES